MHSATICEHPPGLRCSSKWSSSVTPAGASTRQPLGLHLMGASLRGSWHLLCDSLCHSSIHSFIHSLIHAMDRKAFFRPSPGASVFYPSILPSLCASFHPPSHSCQLLIASSRIRPEMYPFIHSFSHSFIQSSSI